jgi:ADP-ribosylglycohydrolase
MRSPILGVAFGRDHEKLRQYVKASTEITHSDPRAFYAALAVAAASLDVTCVDDEGQREFQGTLEVLIPEPDAKEFLELVSKAATSARKNENVARFAEQIGSRNGISGYSYHTVPCVLQVFFKHGNDFEAGLQEIIRAGGDTDTAGAIYGGIIGARAGKQAIPARWLDDIIEWPRTVSWIERLGATVAGALDDPQVDSTPPTLPVPGTLLRNLVFLVIVLAHGLRRLAPPY